MEIYLLGFDSPIIDYDLHSSRRYLWIDLWDKVNHKHLGQIKHKGKNYRFIPLFSDMILDTEYLEDINWVLERLESYEKGQL